MRHKALVPTGTFNTTVSSVWNMISIPTAIYNLFTSQVYPTAESVYKYDGGYVQANPLTNNEGYWTKFPSAQNISYTGAYIDSMKMPVKTGWNIIGSISYLIDGNYLTTEPSGIITSKIFIFYPGYGYQPVTTLAPGLGHWVQVNQNGNIILKADGLSKSGENSFASYDKFIVEDNNGNKQNLYVRNAQLAGTFESVEMPPAPPSGTFDARFSTNDIIRTVDPGDGVVDLSINVDTKNFPVTVTCEINPENGIVYSFGEHSFGKISNSDNYVISKNENTIKLLGKFDGVNSENPKSFMLHQNYPNPFNPETNIQYNVAEDAHVTLEIFDMLGNRIITLINEIKAKGNYNVKFNASELVSGVYVYRFQASSIISSKSFSDVKKLIVMK